MQTPNIVFLFADQMRGSALGCLGAEDVRTPNLDALATEGTLFTRAVANHPVCGPARASILTGLHSLRHGVVVNDMQLRTDLPSVAGCLNEAGYSCGYVGKWHIDCQDRGAFIPPGPRRQGFDDLWAVNNCNHAYLNAYYYRDADPEPVWIEGYEPFAQTEIAADYIRGKAGAESPFCLFVSWGAPHCPYRMVPREYLDLYPPEGIRLKPNATPDANREIIAGYYAHITALDDCVGHLLGVLDECGLRDDTLVVFTSDHGDMLFSQNRGWKKKPWGESVGIPFIARWPGEIPAGRCSAAPVGLVDVMPTLLGLAGVPVPPDRDGHNLAALFRGDETAAPDAQFIGDPIVYADYSFPEWRGIVTRTHTYARFNGGDVLLYDDANDPCQLRNLAAVPACAELRRRSEARLEELLQQADDPFLPSADMARRYVTNRILTSPDREDLVPYLQREFADFVKAAPRIRWAGRDPATMPFVPTEENYAGYFENRKIREGRQGIGRKHTHRVAFHPRGPA